MINNFSPLYLIGQNPSFKSQGDRPSDWYPDDRDKDESTKSTPQSLNDYMQFSSNWYLTLNIFFLLQNGVKIELSNLWGVKVIVIKSCFHT